MATLFDPVRIGPLELANRTVRSATWEGLAEDDGRATERLGDMMVELAEGQVGLIVTGFAYVQWGGQGTTGMIGIHSDEMIPPLQAVTRRVHDAGGRIAMQLVHCGGRSRSKITGEPVLAPSGGPDELYPEEPREMTPGEIESLVEAFGEAARRARAAGFDGVQLHAAHGFLLNQFLGPRTNRRTDEWGGSIEGRSRALMESYRRVRTAVGEDFPVLIKINGQDFIEGGLEIDDTVEVCRRLCDEGIDAIEVSGGTAISGALGPAREEIDSPAREAYFRPEVTRIREAVTCPVIQVGGMRSVEVINDVLGSGEADLVAMSRPLIAEPDLVRRWLSGDLRRSLCSSCSKCFGSARGHGLRCMDGAKARRAGRDI
ncbi:NADH:flavin oxidoreductase [Candidatus Sumerlaeota bacterium]|nr:NADH:flavin oxidoreductase [Candidatus Sumerlaeota bacterium]